VPITILWKCNISSTSEKAFPGVFGNFFVANLHQKKRCDETQKCTCVLSTGVVIASCHALWRVLSNKVIWVLGHCRLKTLHIHTSEWDSLFQVFQICLLSTVTVTPSDLDYVNRSASIRHFRWIHTTPSRWSRVRCFPFLPQGACTPSCGSRRTKSLETVATRVATDISHCIVLFCERYWLIGMWCLRDVWWYTLFHIICFGIELVLWDFEQYLTTFVLTKGLLFDTFFIVLFLQIVSLWSLSI